jgi:hypothetical protein
VVCVVWWEIGAFRRLNLMDSRLAVVGYALSLSVDDAQIEAAIVLFYTTLSMVLCTVVILIDDDR